MKIYFNEIENIKSRIIQQKKTKTDEEKIVKMITTSNANSDAAVVERGGLRKNELKNK